MELLPVSVEPLLPVSVLPIDPEAPVSLLPLELVSELLLELPFSLEELDELELEFELVAPELEADSDEVSSSWV